MVAKSIDKLVSSENEKAQNTLSLLKVSSGSGTNNAYSWEQHQCNNVPFFLMILSITDVI